MQKEITSTSSVKVLENVLLTRSEIFARKRKNDIVEEAQRRAKEIVKEAHQEAEIVSKEAYLFGYERGLLMSIASVTQYMESYRQHAYELHSKLKSEVKQVLEEVLEDESVFIKVVEKWVDETDKDDEHSPVNILMPYANRRYKFKLMELINEKHKGGVAFEYHHEPRFVLKYKNRLAEFYPDEFIEEQTNVILSKYNDLMDCSQLSNDALYHLHSKISEYFPSDNEFMQVDDDTIGDSHEFN